MNALIERMVGWLRAGYPTGLPERDYVPLLAILRRRLSADEILELGTELVRQGMLPADKIDIGVEMTKVLDDLPSTVEVERVAALLREAGWPVTLERDA